MDETENMDITGMPLGFPDSFEQIKEMTMLYSCAMREICTKLENLSQEFELKEARNPIQHINHRLKKTESIRNKMLQRGLPLEYEVMRDEITDIGGIRVICSYINDIYAIANMLKQQDDLLIVREKDYISNPKINGYRSYHLIIGVPVYCADTMEIFPVEVQFRTMEMDLWASMEHRILYKNAQKKDREKIKEELRTYSEKLREMESYFKRFR